MGALIEQFTALGLRFEVITDGVLRVRGELTDGLRSAIRANKKAVLAELSESAARPIDDEEARRWWRIATPRGVREVLFSRAATRRDVADFYPGADAVPNADTS